MYVQVPINLRVLYFYAVYCGAYLWLGFRVCADAVQENRLSQLFSEHADLMAELEGVRGLGAGAALP